MLHHARPIASHITPGAYPNDLHSDLVGPLPLSAGGAKYFVTFLDDYTDGSDVYFLKSKDKTFPAFKSFKIQSERGTYIIQRLRTDYGGEYEDYDFRDFQWEPAVPLNKTAPQNDWVKLLCVKLAPCFEAPA